MYEIDTKFFGEDGALDTERARVAGRKARAQAAGDGYGIIAGGVRSLIEAGKRVVARCGILQRSSTTTA